MSAPRGEFSIIIVKVGVEWGSQAFLFPLIGLITIITSFISPFLIRFGDKIIPKLSKNRRMASKEMEKLLERVYKT
ncbi:MAG: hypothetical protein CM1200mP23_0180 [Nitrososphaerota archaeon]|nr:MAG: hypothetical protein CM1200mP23_0180 [Nitrososphaerota archaeon]